MALFVVAGRRGGEPSRAEPSRAEPSEVSRRPIRQQDSLTEHVVSLYCSAREHVFFVNSVFAREKKGRGRRFGWPKNKLKLRWVC